MIRPATFDDIERIVEMARRFYATTSYAKFAEFDEPTSENLAAALVENGILLVAEHQDRVIGMVGLAVVPFMFNASIRSAHEVIWWVDPEARNTGAGLALLQAVEPACRAIGVAAVQMLHLSNSPPQAAALYERMGYRYSEACYTKEL